MSGNVDESCENLKTSLNSRSDDLESEHVVNTGHSSSKTVDVVPTETGTTEMVRNLIDINFKTVETQCGSFLTVDEENIVVLKKCFSPQPPDDVNVKNVGEEICQESVDGTSDDQVYISHKS